MKSSIIGSKVSIAIGRGRATGIVSASTNDGVLGSYYKIKITSASQTIVDRVGNTNELWVCRDEIVKTH